MFSILITKKQVKLQKAMGNHSKKKIVKLKKTSIKTY